MTEITLFDSRTEIGRACGDGVQFMEMPAALSLIVPSDDWLLNEFFPFWCDWKTQLGLPEGGRYQPGSGMCEWISRELLQRLAVCARKALPGRDVNPAAFEVRLGIPPGFVLNGVTDGGHAPILICTHDENQTCNWWILEAQSWTLAELRTPLKDAIAGGCRLVTVVD
jgi:hypothetical protein